MDAWTEICRVDELPRLGARTLRRPHGGDIAVFRTEGDEVFALLDRCPHKGGPLSQGLVFGRAVACPLHNWTVALDSGCAVAPDHGCTPRFTVRVQDGAVLLSSEELATVAIDTPAPA